MAEGMEYILTCQICLQDFEESGGHVPRILPCSHSLCEKCLKQLIKTFVNGKSVECPECRKKHQATHDVKTFPQNKYIVVNLKQKQKELEVVKCKEHGKELTLYCRGNQCQKAICSKCLTASHREHDVVDIEEKQKEFLLANITLRMEIKRKTIADVKEEIRDFHAACSKELETSQERLVSQIRERFGILRKKLDAHTSVAIQNIVKDIDSIDQHLEVLNGINIDVEVIKSIEESLEGHVSGAKGYEVLRYCATDSLKEDIDKLCGRLMKGLKKPDHTVKSTFSTDYDGDVDSMAILDKKSLVLLGKVKGRTRLTRYELPSGETLDTASLGNGARSVAGVSLAGKLCVAVSYAKGSYHQSFRYGLEDNRIDFHDAGDLAQIVQIHSMAPHRPFALRTSDKLKARLFYVDWKGRPPKVKWLDCDTSPPTSGDENCITLRNFATDVCTAGNGEHELVATSSSRGIQIHSVDTKQEMYFNEMSSSCIAADNIGNVFLCSNQCIQWLNLNTRRMGIFLKAGLVKPVLIRWCNSMSSLIIAHIINEKVAISIVHVD